MRLTKKKVCRNGKHYTDLNLVWEYEGKTYTVRVRPVFASDFGLLLGGAEAFKEETA